MTEKNPRVAPGAKKFQSHGLAKRKAIAYAKRGIRRANRRSSNSGEGEHG